MSTLKQEYFPKDPEKILRSGLQGPIRPTESTRKNSLATSRIRRTATILRRKKPDHEHLAAAGTLVHEIVILSSRPTFDSPAWFNEGLGSLKNIPVRSTGYSRVFKLRLQDAKAIKAETSPVIRIADRNERTRFLSRRHGDHYAQARYLATTCRSRGCCPNSINSSPRSRRLTRQGSRRSNVYSASKTCRHFNGVGKSSCWI